MATITNILGTDSLSASRVTLNDNFAALNDELTQVTALLDPATGNLTGVVDAEVETLSVDGGSAAEFATTGNTLAADTEVDGAITFNGEVAYDVETIAASGSEPAVNSFTSSTYSITSAGFPALFTLNAGNPGQQITLIADGTVNITTTNMALTGGQSAVTIAQNGTLTLRYVATAWYVVSSYGVTIV